MITELNGVIGVMRHQDQSTVVQNQDQEEELRRKSFKAKIHWINVVLMTLLHGFALYGGYLCLTRCKWQTVPAYFVFGVLSGMGITAGAHRLWSHRAYKARFPFQVLLMCLQTMALQNSIYVWCRDHRVHHKFSETDADPHNSNRGFFFAHMGWLLCSKHPDVKTRGKSVDCTDLMADPLIRFQYHYYVPLALFFGLTLPTIIPVWGWNENVWVALFVCGFYRYVYVLHCTWFVNSWAHMFGMRQYDKSIQPSETMFVAYQSFGEGYHNYHHTFPYDYSASEFDWRYNFNFTTMFIDFFALIGLVYDRRKVDPSVVKNRVQRTGETTKYHQHRQHLMKHRVATTAVQTVLGTAHFWVPFLIRCFTISS